MAKICMDYYTGKYEYSEGNDVEQDILNYVTKYKEIDYPKIIGNDSRWTVFYHLSDIRKALLSWYPFKKEDSVLEIGAGMGALTGLLCEKCKYVAAVELSQVRAQAIYQRYKNYLNLDIFVGNVVDITFEKKFDYITLIGVLEYQGNYSYKINPYIEFLKSIKSLLKPNGKILIAIENKYGIKYWCGAPEDHTGKIFDGINNYPDGGKARTFDKAELISILQSACLNKYKFYYPMPDYKLPQMVFSDEGLPKENMPHRVIPYYLYYPTLIANEKKIYDDLLKNHVFDFFANSYLIECGKDESQLSDIIMASITADRKRTHQMETIVHLDGTVEKAALNADGLALIEGAYENIKELQEKNIAIIPHVFENDKIIMPYIEAPSLEDVLVNKIKSHSFDEFYSLLNKYYDDILKSSEESKILDGDIVEIAERQGISLHIFNPVLKTAYIDLIPHNCMVREDKYVYFDQEFKKRNYPASFMLFRTFKNLYAFNTWVEDILPLEAVKEKYDLNNIWSIYDEIDKKCLEELTERGISDRLGAYWFVDPMTYQLNSLFLMKRLSLENMISQKEEKEKELISQEEEKERELISLKEKTDKLIKILREQIEAEKFNYDALEKSKNIEIYCLKTKVAELEQKYNEISNAFFWKVTEPLRKMKDTLHIKRVKMGNSKAKKSTQSDLLDKHIINNERPCPESSISQRDSIEVLMEKMEMFDVISFDIFDTMLYRGVSNPEDIFSIVGLKIGVLNFKQMRINAEYEARKNTTKPNGEINIFDIYEVLSKYVTIDIEETIKLEFETELDYLYANPYIYELFNLVLKKKIVVYASDMYWPQKYIEKMLKKCGYIGFDNGFVSCEYFCGKGNGELQKIVASNYLGKKIIHIGDNYQSDVIGSRSIGLETLYYKNCNVIGNPNRPQAYESLVSSVYKSIVNYKLHSGTNIYSPNYEHGFLYGGILNCGYCEWLNKYAIENNVDKILFLARDCDIVSKVYNKYYNVVRNEYIIVSRFSIYQVIFSDNTEDYIQYFFKTRANLASQSIRTALIETDMEFLIKELQFSSLNPDAILDGNNYEDVRTFIYDHKKCIEEHFISSKNAAIKYFSQAIGDSQKICISDLGWGGTILVYMRRFINKYINDKCEIVGTYFAAATNQETNLYVGSSIMEPYLFSYAQNRDLGINIRSEQGLVGAMLMEAMFSSESATLMKYLCGDDGNIDFLYGQITSDKQQIKEIQNGIMDFADEYNKITNKDKAYFNISAVEAFEPFNMIKYDFKYNYKIFREVREFEFPLPRMGDNHELTTIGEIMIKKGLL